MKRVPRYIAPIRTRLDAPTADALHRAADVRGADVGAMARLLIEAGVGRLDKLSPVRRIRSTVEHPEDLADAVKALGSLAGNAERIYQFMKKTRQIDDAALSALKINIQQTAARVRAALGNFDDA